MYQINLSFKIGADFELMNQLDEEVDRNIGTQGFEQARRINARHQRTRYDELLAKGYSRDQARELVAEEVE